ncbi:hypothetical protein B0H19DRAFT_924063, partial [Mycena capillaripes]
RNKLKHEDNGNERELVLRTGDQEYGQVKNFLGSQQIEVMCFDGETRIAHIGGKMGEQPVAIEQGDIVLLALRNSQENTPAQVIQKYTADETRRSESCYSRLRGVRSFIISGGVFSVRELGELPENARFNDPELEFDETFEFGGDGEIDIDDI